MDPRPVMPLPLAGPLTLSPFRATMLQPGLVGDPASARLFGRPWRGVGGRLDSWERRRKVVQDQTPALYVHEYADGGTVVRGIVGLLDMTRRSDDASLARVVPHEEIHPRQADELADRMGQMRLQPAPILLVHEASPELRALTAAATAEAPMRQYADHAGQHHRIWALRESGTHAAVQRALSDARAVIADGHHRYAAYLRLQARDPGSGFDLGLAMLVDHDATPLHLRAIHRVLPRVTVDDVRAAARLVDAPIEFRPAALRPEDVDGLVVTDGRRWAAVKLPHSPDRTLVETVHERLIPALPRGPWDIGYHHSQESALAALRHRAATALLLPPPAYPEIRASAFAGRMLPEKATSFQPKPHLGAIMRRLHDE
ncbi:MAG: DUF1015 family protein [Nocardioides sp.]|uniref:DUF1015 family protein n=1 Tax=Nocardioides sp. TaxID=35761 RepID=UPI0039E4A805